MVPLACRQLMKCPECGSRRTRVIATKHVKEPVIFVRRRCCDGCGHRYWTQQPCEELLSRYAIDWRGSNGTPYVEIVESTAA